MEVFDSFLINSFDSGMDIEICRPGGNVLEYFGQDVVRNACIISPHSRRSDLTDLILILGKTIKLLMDDLLIILFIFASKAISELFEVVLSNDSFRQKFLRV